MKVLSFDPGPNQTAWALLEGDQRQQTVLDSDMIQSTPLEVASLLVLEKPTLIAVELTAGFTPKPQAVVSLMKTATVAGMICGVAYPLPVFTMVANAGGNEDSWRLRLTRNPRAKDTDVRNALMVMGLRIKGTTVHERDAIGLGAVTLLSSRLVRALFNLGE
jgi:hypothetical protein